MTGPKAIAAAAVATSAAALAGFLLRAFAGFSYAEAAIAAACLLIALAQMTAFAGRRRERSELSARLFDLGTVTGDLSREVHELKARADRFERSMEERAHAQNEQIAAQMQVFESLIKRLAEDAAHDEIAGSAAAPETSAPAGSAAEADEAGRGREGSPPDARLLETIRRSLESNRVDLYMQPIVTLPQRKIRYYESLTRLRDASGRVLMPTDYLPVAEPAGMMPTIDNLLLLRSVAVVRRLYERNREIGVFCNISAHSLLDSDFFPQFVEYLEINRELKDALVLEFPQAMVSAFGPMERESLAALTELGYRLSMDHVEHLDIDLAGLSEQNFRFVKVAAGILLGRMEQARAPVQAADLHELLLRHGIELIAEKIEDERTVVNLLDFEVGLGQGFLFGEPRLVRGDARAAGLADLEAAG